MSQQNGKHHRTVLPMISPNWEYKLVRTKEAREFIATHFPWFLKTYDALPYAVQKSDAIRYAWLYIHGGVYFDLDMQLRKPLDDLFSQLDGTLYLCNSANVTSYYLGNAFMASVPQNPVWITMLERIAKGTPWPNGLFFGKHLTVMFTTGSAALTKVIHETKTPYTIVPRRLISQCSVCELSNGTGTCRISSEHFVMVNGASHWNSWDSKVINFVMCNFKTILFIVLIVLTVRYMGTFG